MYRKLTFLCFILFSVMTWGQDVSYPKNGLVLHYDFNGNVRDKVQGVYLKSVSTGYHEQSKQLTKDDVSFVESPDGEQGAMKILTADIPFNFSPDKYPDLTVVMKVKIDNEQDAGNPMFFLCETDDKQVFAPLRKLKADKGFHLKEEVMTDTTAFRLVYIGTGTEIVKTASIPKESWETVLVSFSAKDSSVTLACRGKKWVTKPRYDYYHGAYTSMRLFPETGNGKWYSWLIGDSFDRINGAVDDLRIYNRVLTDEEISGIFGEEVVTVEGTGGSFINSEAFAIGAVVVYVLMILYALYLLIFRPGKLKEITPGSIAKEKQNNKSLSEEKRDEHAMQCYEQVLKKWGYTPEKDNEEQMELRYSKSGLEAFSIRKLLLKSLSYGSSNPEIVEKQNRLIGAYNNMTERKFNGSSFYIVLVVICLYFISIKFGEAWHADSSVLVNILMLPVRQWPVTLGLLVYVLFSFGPSYMDFKGGTLRVRKIKRLHRTESEQTDSDSGAKATVGGALLVTAILGGIWHFITEVFRAVPNSMSYVLKNVRSGAVVGGGSVFTGGGLIMIAITLALLWFLVIIAGAIIMLSPLVIGPYKFVRNYILYY